MHTVDLAGQMDVGPVTRKSSSDQSVLENTWDTFSERAMEQNIRNPHIPDAILALQAQIHIHLPGSSIAVPLQSGERYDITVFPSAGETLLTFPVRIPRVVVDNLPNISRGDPKVFATLLV